MHALTVGISCVVLTMLFASPVRGAKVELQETDELFANPGLGWQTFQRFADEDKNLAGLPSGSAYFRFYWREIESADGQVDFAKFDALLAHAHRAGQKLAFRIMCTGSGDYMDVPKWLKEKGCKGVEFMYEGKRHWVPDFTDPLFQQAHQRLIRELGARYDGHPDMDLLDMGSVGLWGEWHMSSTEQIDTGKPVPLPPVEVRMGIIDAWRNAFSRTSKVILIGSTEGMMRAVSDGYGWRADCLGDMGGFTKNWNHMKNFYPQQIERTHAEDAWKAAPVAFETCWDMRKWKEENWDIGLIFDYALQCHASYINNKSAPIPEGTRPEIERVLRKLGYRLVARAVQHESVVQAGSELKVQIAWENVGVAPPYRDYRVAWRLKPVGQDGGKAIVSTAGPSIQGWLPGQHESTVASRVPTDLAHARYELELGIVGADSRMPEVRLANKKRDTEGWYRVSEVEVR